MTYVQYQGRCFEAHPVYPTSTSIAARLRQIIRDAESIARAGKKQHQNYRLAECESMKAALRELAATLEA
jgi:hypothetical protein